MMELTIKAKNKAGTAVAVLTMTVPMLDVNSVMSQFKVLVAPTDADNYEMACLGLLTPHRKNTVAELPKLEPGELLDDEAALAIATRFAPKR